MSGTRTHQMVIVWHTIASIILLDDDFVPNVPMNDR